MAEKEKNDEILKRKSAEWWSLYSQDYVEPGDTPHLGARMNENDEQFIKYLSEIDKSFKQDAYFAQKRNKNLFSKLMDENNIRNKKVLEIGCGLGAHSEQLSKLGAKLTSIDISDTSVAVTKRRFKLKKLDGEILKADAENLPFDDQTFDYVWTWGVIHHSPNTAQCASEINRVLKNGGELAIMLYNKNSFYNWFNVILRYGIFKGKLFNHSIQDLHNMYTDGKEKEGSPLAKYYSSKEIEDNLFPNFNFYETKAFEQKKAFSFFVPSKYRRKFEHLIPDNIYDFLWKRFGFLLYKKGKKLF